MVFGDYGDFNPVLGIVERDQPTTVTFYNIHTGSPMYAFNYGYNITHMELFHQ